MLHRSATEASAGRVGRVPLAPDLAGGTGPGNLAANDVTAWFSRRVVLERASLTMERSTVTALIGPSGCGKSTFLRVLNRMHKLDPSAGVSGVVELDGVDIYGAGIRPTDCRLQIGMVFQKPNPFVTMTVAQNVLSGLRIAGLKTGDRDWLVEQCLTRAGLWTDVRDRLNDPAGNLSVGQQQRLCIARALAVRPRVLLMDEPCAALDPMSTRVIEETIHELHHEVTIVIVTHNLGQAQRVSSTCAFFLAEEVNGPGRIIESGATEQIFNSPNDRRTADYIAGRFG